MKSHRCPKCFRDWIECSGPRSCDKVSTYQDAEEAKAFPGIEQWRPLDMVCDQCALRKLQGLDQ